MRGLAPEHVEKINACLWAWGPHGAWPKEGEALRAVLERLEALEKSHSKMIGLAKQIWHADDGHASPEVKDIARLIIDGAREALG